MDAEHNPIEIGKESESMGNVLNKNKIDSASTETSDLRPDNTDTKTVINPNLEFSGVALDSNNDETDQKPPVVHKKVKLKRSHILSKLSASAPSIAVSEPVPKEENTKSISDKDESSSSSIVEKPQLIADVPETFSVETKEDSPTQSSSVVYKKVKLKRHNIPLPKPISVETITVQNIEKQSADKTTSEKPTLSEQDHVQEPSKTVEIEKKISTKPELCLESKEDSKDSDLDFNLVLGESSSKGDSQISTSSSFLRETLESLEADMADLEKVIKISDTKINYHRLNSQDYREQSQSEEKPNELEKSDEVLQNLVDITETDFTSEIEANKNIESNIENLIGQEVGSDTNVENSNKNEEATENLDMLELSKEDDITEDDNESNFKMLIEDKSDNTNEDKSDLSKEDSMPSIKFDEDNSVTFEIKDDDKKDDENLDSNGDKTEESIQSISSQQVIELLENLPQKHDGAFSQGKSEFPQNFPQSDIQSVPEFPQKESKENPNKFLAQPIILDDFLPKETTQESIPEPPEVLQDLVQQTEVIPQEFLPLSEVENQDSQLEKLNEIPKDEIDAFLNDFQKEENEIKNIDDKPENSIAIVTESNESKSFENLPESIESKELPSPPQLNEPFEGDNFSLQTDETNFEPSSLEEKTDFLNIEPIEKDLEENIENLQALSNESDLNCLPINNIIMQDSELIKSFLEEPEIIRDETDIDILISAAENSKRVDPISEEITLESSLENKIESNLKEVEKEESSPSESVEDKPFEFSSGSLLKASLLRPIGDKNKTLTSQQLLEEVTDHKSNISVTSEENRSSMKESSMLLDETKEVLQSRISSLQTDEISIAKVPEEPIKITREERKRKSELTEKKSSEKDEETQVKIPKISIKAIPKPKVSKHDPITIDIDDEPITKTSHSPTIPKIRIKPVVKPPDYEAEGEKVRLPHLVDKSGAKATHIEVIPKISIRTLLSKSEHSEDYSREPCTIAPVTRGSSSSKQNSPTPRITIKPVVGIDSIPKADHEEDEVSSSHVSIKSVRPESQLSPNFNQKITIKPIKNDDYPESSRSSRKLALQETEQFYGRDRSPKAERIVLKINKDNESMKSQLITDKTYKDENSDKLKKITLKLSKEGGHPEILQSSSMSVKTIDNSSALKRLISKDTTIEAITTSPKRMKSEVSITKSDMVFESPDLSINIVKTDTSYPKKENVISDDITIVRVRPETSSQSTKSKTPHTELVEESKLKEILMKYSKKKMRKVEKQEDSDSSDDVKIVEVSSKPTVDLDESSSQDVMIIEDDVNVQKIEPPPPAPMPKKRGRPRKVPLVVRPTDDTAVIEEVPTPETIKSPRSKRSCTEKRTYTPRARRGRGGRGGGRTGGRGSRGGKRGGRQSKESRLSLLSDISTIPDLDIDTTCSAQNSFLNSSGSLNESGQMSTSVFEEEETRMGADSEINTTVEISPVKPIANLEQADESRSSSNAESNRNKRGRLEIAEIDIQVTGPDQIAEYYWANNGPYMLQEQIAQYLGVKSFKRKYPGMTRHAVDMQERDYLRENGLASEALCDMGLTAVLSSEILDIMFTDFQDKYEEYRKYQREKQVKDVTNKQKALSLATSVDKGKVDCVRQAIRSAASWNENLNKTRSEQRRCYMDLQTFTVMYPKNRRRKTNVTTTGSYPVALVPGQFSEYYKKYSPEELKYLPVNTVLYGPIIPNKYGIPPDHSDGSCSDSDSSGSDSDSSDNSGSSSDNEPSQPPEATSETCKLCTTPVNVTPMGAPKPKINKMKEVLIFCTQCKNGIHPSCSDLTQEMLVHVRAYQWQCTDCKTCWQCREPCDDDKMLFCDRCDRGYHIYCVGLRKVPTGRWHCSQCVA